MEPKYEINFNYEAFAIATANSFGQGCSVNYMSHFNFRAYLMTLRHNWIDQNR